MRLFRFFPILGVVLAIYNALVFIAGTEIVSRHLWTLPLPKGINVPISVGETLIIAGIAILFFEILKATSAGIETTYEHIVSMLIFVVFLVELFVVEKCATTTFFILTMMQLLEVVAGITVTISTSRRDVEFHQFPFSG